MDAVLARMSGDAFRSRFHLGQAERATLQAKGLTVILEHAREFIATRVAPAAPIRDGRQTPWRGHPVFIAQHATATCCRGCLEKWHGIPRGLALDATQQAYVVRVIEAWLIRQRNTPPV